MFSYGNSEESKEEERSPHTHAFLIVFIRKLIRNPRRREGAHTHAFLIVFIKKLIRNPRRREGAHAHAFLIVFIRKLIRNRPKILKALRKTNMLIPKH